MCQIEKCRKKRQKKTIFCCRHEKKIPKKMMREIIKFFKKYPGGYPIIELDRLVQKANFSIKIDDYEKRYKFWLKQQNKILGKKRVIVIPGCSQTIEAQPLWKKYLRVIKEMKFGNNQYYFTGNNQGDDLLKILEQFPPCAVVLLGEAGVNSMIPPFRREHGTIHGGQKILTPEDWEEAAWKDRPAQPRNIYNYYFQAPTISCEPHPEEYDDFGEGQIREITRCLEWAKQFLYKGE